MSGVGFDRERFREAMNGTSAADLALQLGCPKSSISMYLSGKREPSKMAIQLMALVLGVNPAWLCGLDVPKTSNAKIISAAAPALTSTESQLVARFRQLSPEHQDAVMQIVSTMALTDAEKNNAPAGLAEAN